MATHSDPTRPTEFIGDMNRIALAAEMPPEKLNDTLVHEILTPALLEVFLDGEMRMDHPGFRRNPSAEYWFGRQRFSQGQFAVAASRLIERGSADPDMHAAFDRVAQVIGMTTGRETAHDFYTSSMRIGPRSTYDLSDGAMGGVQLTGTQLRMSNATPLVTLPRVPEHVLHYGPSLQGGAMVDEQVRMVGRGEQPFVYHAASKGPYIGYHLQNYFARMLELTMGAPENEAAQAAQMYVDADPRGLAAAGDQLLAAGRSAFGRTEQVHKMGLVVCSGLHTAGVEELRRGFQNAHALLEDDAGFALRALVSVPGRGQVGGDQMLELAREAGFVADGTNVHTLSSHVDSQAVKMHVGYLTKA